MKKRMLIAISAIMLCFMYTSAYAVESLEIYADRAVSELKREFMFTSSPFIYASDEKYEYIPIDDIAPALGLSLGWDLSRHAEICIFDDTTYYLYPNKNEIETENGFIWTSTPCIIKDDKLYVSKDNIELMTGVSINVKSELEEYGIIETLNSTKIYINGIEKTIDAKPYMYDLRLYIPADSVLTACGYTLGWDSQKNAVIAYKDGVYSYIYMNEGKVSVGLSDTIFSYKPINIKGTMYISSEMLEKVTGYSVISHGEYSEYKKRDTMSSTTRTDAYRLSGNVYKGGGVTVVNKFGMELVSASSSEAIKYAGVINAVADSLSDVNVYNILVPTAAEFYAPLEMYPNQLAGIRTVYENLSDKVTPVNVYDTLKAHASEKIYFSTDHHWTQRGAYYAYKEFIELKGGEIEPLSAFTNYPSYNFVGSFAGFARGTTAGNILKGSPELLERFMPKYATVGTVFSDCAVQRPQYTVKAVNTSNNSYSCFIGGDGPVTIFYTDAPSDESIVIIKESFGNAFATWAMNNYKKVCVVDPRKFNGFGGNNNYFNLDSFCKRMDIDDVVFINYPVVVASSGIRSAILSMR